MRSLEFELRLHLFTVTEDEKLLFSTAKTHPPTQHTQTTSVFSPGNGTGREEKWVSRLLYGTCAGKRGGEQRGARGPV